MREIPILFRGPMVKAIIEEQKTMTRRIVKPQPKFIGRNVDGVNILSWPEKGIEKAVVWADMILKHCPYGHPGDLLWIKETWQQLPSGFDEVPPEDRFIYRATDKLSEECTKWRPSIFMPKRAARLWIENVSVKVERLQEISMSDAIDEGALTIPNTPEYQKAFDEAVSKKQKPPLGENAIQRFARLWNSINAKPKPVYVNGEIVRYESYPWDDIQETRTYRGKPWLVIGNPWVWCVSFKGMKSG